MKPVQKPRTDLLTSEAKMFPLEYCAVPASTMGRGRGSSWDEREGEKRLFERIGLLDGGCVSKEE